MSTDQNAAVVTGRAQGVGLAIARELAGAGRPVALLDRRDTEAGDQVASTLGPAHIFVRCDVAKEDEVTAAMTEVADRIGPIEVLINNAGIGRVCRPRSHDQAGVGFLFAVDLTGGWLCAKHTIPQMRSIVPVPS